MNDRRTVIEKLPWWKHAPDPGDCEADLDWGWLVIYDDLRFEFIDQRPSDDEIANRTSCKIPTHEEGR